MNDEREFALKKIVVIVLIYSFTMIAFAQSNLRLPLNIKPAYENGTRSFDGMPGKNYWQNKSEYDILIHFI